MVTYKGYEIHKRQTVSVEGRHTILRESVWVREVGSCCPEFDAKKFTCEAEARRWVDIMAARDAFNRALAVYRMAAIKYRNNPMDFDEDPNVLLLEWTAVLDSARRAISVGIKPASGFLPASVLLDIGYSNVRVDMGGNVVSVGKHNNGFEVVSFTP